MSMMLIALLAVLLPALQTEAHWLLVVLWILSEVELIDLSWVPAPGKDTSGG